MDSLKCFPGYYTIESSVEEDERQRNNSFTKLKMYVAGLLELLNNPVKSSSVVISMVQYLRISPSSYLQPFVDLSLLPLLLLLETAVDCRSSKRDHMAKTMESGVRMVSDRVAEGVLQCLEELLKKCQLGSVNQMVIVMKKLTYAALLSPSDASEEFRVGVIKCFKELVMSLIPCSDEGCSCKQIHCLLDFKVHSDMQSALSRSSETNIRNKECILNFFHSHSAAPAVGHWLSLLLNAADTEAARGHQGNTKIRVEAFFTVRVLVAKVGNADSLAFFLPGVVSQFSKVLSTSKRMISGAAGSAEAIDQAIRGLAEYLMIVLNDEANLASFDMPVNLMACIDSDKDGSINLLLDGLDFLSISTPGPGGTVKSTLFGESITSKSLTAELKMNRSSKSSKEFGSLCVDRTREWIIQSSKHVCKLLAATFPYFCVHPSKKVRLGLVAAIEGLLLKCRYILKDISLMLLECLCALVVDDFDEVFVSAQRIFVHLFASDKHLLHDVSALFNRLIEKLPKAVLANEESLALSHAMKLLVVVYYSGPWFILPYLQSPVTATRFLEIFSVCFSQNLLFIGGLDKAILMNSGGYLQMVSEMNNSSCSSNNIFHSSSIYMKVNGYDLRSPLEAAHNFCQLPHIPPWFSHARSQKLYDALAAILRLTGLFLATDLTKEEHLSVISDILLGFFRELVCDIRGLKYDGENLQYWYARTGSGELLRQATTAGYILNEMIFGVSDHTIDYMTRLFQQLRVKNEKVENPELTCSIFKISKEKAARSRLIDCIGRILHEYLSSELWNLPVDHETHLAQQDSKRETVPLGIFHDAAMLHVVMIHGIGIFAMCLRDDFISSGFLYSTLYLLLENLVCSNIQVKRAADTTLHVFAVACGYSTVGELVLENSDYLLDSICKQLHHLDLNPHVPNVLASVLSFIGLAQKMLPLLVEPLCSVSLELEILGRHQHPELTLSFLKAISEIMKVSRHEACSLICNGESFLVQVKSIVSEVGAEPRIESHETLDGDRLEMIMFQFNDTRRYSRVVGSVVNSCLMTVIPLLASMKQAVTLLSLDIVEDGLATLSKVQEAFRHEEKTKETIKELVQSFSLHQFEDTLEALAEEVNDENKLLPAMNKIWPFLIASLLNKNTVDTIRCLRVITNVVHVCGGDFFTRRFFKDGQHLWNLLSSSPFQNKQNFSKQEKMLLLPYRSTVSSEDSKAEVSNMRIQVAVLDMIASLAKDKASSSALQLVLKKVSGLVTGIACSGVGGLRDASINALHALALIDPDLIWLLLADVYFSLNKEDSPLPPSTNLPLLSDVLPSVSPREFLFLQYGGSSFGFDVVNFSSVETVFRKLHFSIFASQMYVSTPVSIRWSSFSLCLPA